MQDVRLVLATRILFMIGTLCFIAMAFKLVPTNYGIFAGIAFYMFAGVIRGVGGRKT